MLKMCKEKLHKWMITFLIFTTLLNKRSHTGCIVDKRHNNADIHGDFTSTLFKSAVMQFCVITAEVSPLKTYCENATITAGCQQWRWRSRPWSPAAIKNFMSSGRGEFHLLVQELKLYHDHSERSFRCHWVWVLLFCLRKRRTKITWSPLTLKSTKKWLRAKLWTY